MRKKRLLFPELPRILAAFFVVLIHVTAIGIYLLSALTAELFGRLSLTQNLV